MTDPWRQYFFPRPYRSRPPPPATMSEYELAKLEIEACLANKPPIEVARVALSKMCEMIDTRAIFVVSMSSRETNDFGHAIGRRVNHVSQPEQLMGLRGAAVVFAGRWKLNPEYMAILHALSVRKELDEWKIAEWRFYD